LYWHDTHRKAPKWAFLGGGSIPYGLEEDDLAVTAEVAMAANEHDGTCKISGR
jgi:hypothetical protein